MPHDGFLDYVELPGSDIPATKSFYGAVFGWSFTDYGPDYVNAFTANYAALAKTYKVPLLPFLLQGAYGVPGMMQGDRTHATNKGNEVVAKNVLGLVEPLLVK